MKIWKQKALALWVGLNGIWPAVPWDLHETWHSRPNGLLLVSLDFVAHTIGLIAVSWLYLLPSLVNALKVWRNNHDE
jgi:hypothetical protein